MPPHVANEGSKNSSLAEKNKKKRQADEQAVAGEEPPSKKQAKQHGKSKRASADQQASAQQQSSAQQQTAIQQQPNKNQQQIPASQQVHSQQQAVIQQPLMPQQPVVHQQLQVVWRTQQLSSGFQPQHFGYQVQFSGPYFVAGYQPQLLQGHFSGPTTPTASLPLSASPAFPEQQHVAQQQQPIAQEQQPIAQEQQPIAQEQQPIAQEQQPIAQEQRPIAQEQQPVAREQDPVPQANSNMRQSQENRPVTPASNNSSWGKAADPFTLAKHGGKAKPSSDPVLQLKGHIGTGSDRSASDTQKTSSEDSKYPSHQLFGGGSASQKHHGRRITLATPKMKQSTQPDKGDASPSVGTDSPAWVPIVKTMLGEMCTGMCTGITDILTDHILEFSQAAQGALETSMATLRQELQDNVAKLQQELQDNANNAMSQLENDLNELASSQRQPATIRRYPQAAEGAINDTDNIYDISDQGENPRSYESDNSEGNGGDDDGPACDTPDSLFKSP